MKKPRLLQEKETYTFDYPEAIAYERAQLSIFWPWWEPKVEDDLHDLRTKCTESEVHGITTTLKLFTLYEIFAGNEYWGGFVKDVFRRPDIQRMANAFGMFEINVHAPFYNELNRVLGLDTDEFYTSYVDDPILKDRMDWVDTIINSKKDINDILMSVATFSIVEGAVLYSSFAFIKHFQAEGKDLLKQVCSGINFSVRDENLHAEGGAWLFQTLLSESGIEPEVFEERINEVCDVILEHERAIISKVFEKGKMEGITATQLERFVESRLDVCLNQLGYESRYSPSYNPIKSWFYKDINAPRLHDFFSSVGSDYNRNWNKDSFTWETDEDKLYA